MKRLVPLLVVLLVCLVATNASAQEKKKGEKKARPSLEERFKQLDKNGDKSLSLDEFKAAPWFKDRPDRAEKAFKAMDSDNDGKVTFEEFSKAMKERIGRGKRGEKKE